MQLQWAVLFTQKAQPVLFLWVKWLRHQYGSNKLSWTHFWCYSETQKVCFLTHFGIGVFEGYNVPLLDWFSTEYLLWPWLHIVKLDASEMWNFLLQASHPITLQSVVVLRPSTIYDGIQCYRITWSACSSAMLTFCLMCNCWITS